MPNDIQAWVIGYSNFWGAGYNDYLICSLFRNGIYPATEANSPTQPTIHFIEHPQLGMFTTCVWQLPSPKDEMKKDEYGRILGEKTRSYGILFSGHHVPRISEVQHKKIESLAFPVYKREWEECYDAHTRDHTRAVNAISLPTIQLTEVPQGQELRYSLGKRVPFAGKYATLGAPLTEADVITARQAAAAKLAR